MSLRDWAARRSNGLPPARTSVVASRVWVDTGSEARLATQLLRPADPSLRRGTVLIRSERPLGSGSPLEQLAIWLAEDGRNVVLQNCRGRGASEGTFEPFVHEPSDGAATRDWLAKQPELDGPLVLIGLGYAAFTAWAMAAHSAQVAGMAVGFGARDPYAWLHRGGILQLATALSLAARLDGRDGIEPDHLDLARAAGHRPLREWDRVAVRALSAYRTWLDHPERDAWWEARTPRLSPAQKTLIFGGWGESALAANLADHAVLVANSADVVLSIGPWGAKPRARRERPRAMGVIAKALLAFVADAVGDSAPRIKTQVFVIGEGWQQNRPWPPPRATQRTLFLRSGGNANTFAGDGTLAAEAPDVQPADSFVFDPADPAASVGHALAEEGLGGRGDVLCFSAPPRTHPFELAGGVTLHAFADADATPFDLCARLVAVRADGKIDVLCEGGARQHSAQEGAIEIALGVVAARLRQGDFLRLEIAGAAVPRFAPSERHERPVRHTLHHDATRPSALRFHALDF